MMGPIQFLQILTAAKQKVAQNATAKNTAPTFRNTGEGVPNTSNIGGRPDSKGHRGATAHARGGRADKMDTREERTVDAPVENAGGEHAETRKRPKDPYREEVRISKKHKEENAKYRAGRLEDMARDRFDDVDYEEPLPGAVRSKPAHPDSGPATLEEYDALQDRIRADEMNHAYAQDASVRTKQEDDIWAAKEREEAAARAKQDALLDSYDPEEHKKVEAGRRKAARRTEQSAAAQQRKAAEGTPVVVTEPVRITDVHSVAGALGVAPESIPVGADGHPVLTDKQRKAIERANKARELAEKYPAAPKEREPVAAVVPDAPPPPVAAPTPEPVVEPAPVAAAAAAAGEHTPPVAAQIAAEAQAERTFVQRVEQSFKNAGKGERVAKGAGAVVSAGVAVDGVHRVFKKSSEERPVSWTERITGMGEIAAGIAGGFFSLTRGGRG